jgi:hypothetical protein
MDVAFSPYVNFTPGGVATFGTTASPNINLLKSTILADPIAVAGGATITKIQLQLQVFVRNDSNDLVVASESLRAIVEFGVEG